MARIDKLLERLLSLPSDMTWDELTTIMNYFGFTEHNNGKTSGSSRKFSNNKQRFVLHKPHPKNVCKRYMLQIVINALKKEGYIS
ncbi:putative uncharacterized protein [Clostridium sp. CAG:967]|nr:putative uncharacterized protein [Clostridium sp. CAG:967]